MKRLFIRILNCTRGFLRHWLLLCCSRSKNWKTIGRSLLWQFRGSKQTWALIDWKASLSLPFWDQLSFLEPLQYFSPWKQANNGLERGFSSKSYDMERAVFIYWDATHIAAIVAKHNGPYVLSELIDRHKNKRSMADRHVARFLPNHFLLNFLGLFHS